MSLKPRIRLNSKLLDQLLKAALKTSRALESREGGKLESEAQKHRKNSFPIQAVIVPTGKIKMKPEAPQQKEDKNNDQ